MADDPGISFQLQLIRAMRMTGARVLVILSGQSPGLIQQMATVFLGRPVSVPQFGTTLLNHEDHNERGIHRRVIFSSFLTASLTAQYRRDLAARIAAGLTLGRLRRGSIHAWSEIQTELEMNALTVRFINWKGIAAHPDVAWIITTLAGPGNKLKRPDQLHGRTLFVSDEDVEAPTRRMLDSAAQFPLHLFRRVEGAQIRYEYLGLAERVVYDPSPDYPHWKVTLDE